MDKLLSIEKDSKKLYKEIKLNNIFKKYPKKVKGLRFGYICPGAMKTIAFLNKNSTVQHDVLKSIKLLTDLQFFVEIYVVYKDYLEPKLVSKMKIIIGKKSCSISMQITEQITRLFGQLPDKVRLNLPDDFYHIRHNTLICSRSKKLAKQRIKLLKTLYQSKKKSCLGRRNGVSGCRDCCKTKKIKKYNNCVRECMEY